MSDPVRKIDRLRAKADALRAEANDVDREADRLEANWLSAAKPLKGRWILEALERVVDPGEELHYVLALRRLRASGYVPAGKSPANTLLAALQRSPYWTSVSPRTGLYRRNAPGGVA